MKPFTTPLLALFLAAPLCHAGVADPQLGTDHPWYPGELAMSTFERLFATQAAQYERATGVRPVTDHDRALAAWFFRNTHYAHGEEGKENLWGRGFDNGTQNTTREYWTGLFAHGFGLCGTTHAQWTAEMDALLGHCRGRVIGTNGHNSFEAYLTGGPYGEGRWAMLDHDLSTVIFDDSGSSLLGLDRIVTDWKKFTRRERSMSGWLICGLHTGDGGSYQDYRTAEYLSGYAGPPPVVRLRPGESLRRYFEPGLEGGKTPVFWGRNYRTGGIPGPERSRTWVNQPEAMHGSRTGTAHVDGQVRHGNAVYRWRPDFAGGGYREGARDESADHVTLEFYTPYIIGATPADDSDWGIYKPGGRNGLVLHGRADCAVAISVDGGTTWQEAGAFRDGLDLTDHAKGHRQYLLRLGAGATRLAGSELTITTVCQANPATFPRLKDGGARVEFAASGQGIVSHGPNVAQAAPCIIEGAFDSPSVTLEFATPRGEPIRTLFTAAHVASSNPPRPDVAYRIEYSLDAGKSWQPALRDGRFVRRGVEPADFWSQSLWAARVDLPAGSAASRVRVRYRNDGGKRYLRAEGHLLYPVAGNTSRVTYRWTDSTGEHEETKVLRHQETWPLATAANVKTRWVEIAAD